MSIIQAEHVSFTYNGTQTPALRDVSVSVKEGECILLCGKSGCGKTTFSRLLNGLSPSFFKGELQGEILSCSLNASTDPIESYVTEVGSVFQNPKTQYFNVNTTDEMAFPCENTGMDSKKIRLRVLQIAEQFQLESLLDKNIFRLSGGQKQQIAFGTACVLYPRLLVLDEPTSNLDYEAIQRLQKMILKMKEMKMTIVIAEHRLSWLKDLADRCLYFDNGQLIHSFTRQQFRDLSLAQLHSLGLRSFDIEPFIGQIKMKTSDHSPLDKLMITTEDLVIGYDKNTLVRSFSHFELAHGEILGLMGLNGCGKSTLARTLCGLLKPVSGKILLEGKPASAKQLMKKSFLVMQDVNYQLFSDSVGEEVLLGSTQTEHCDEVLASLGLLELKERHPMSLSGGQKQRTAIASALLSGKELIILDEPTSGLDHYHMDQFGQLLQMLKKQNKAVIVITHDEELASRWCDRIVYLNKEEKR